MNSSFNFFNQENNGSSNLFAEGLNKGPKVINQNISVRMNFLKKVYGILSLQLAFTTLVSAVVLLSPSIQYFLTRNTWFLIVNALVSVVTIFPLLSKRNSYPTNFYLLGFFTVMQSIAIGAIVSLYDLTLVLQAFFLTAIIVASLTMYTFQTKHDITYLNTTLSSLLLLTVIGGISQLFLRSQLLETGLIILGVLLFSIYIVYDTQMIMKHLSAEEYIVAVINLYLDIINLFIKILRLLDQLKGREEENKRKKRRND